MLIKREFYINGEWVAPASLHDFHVINPSNEEPCAIISLGSHIDADAAVAAAKAAFPKWSSTRENERARLISYILPEYERRINDIAQALSIEMGAPIDFASAEQAPCLPWHAEGFLTAMAQIKWQQPLSENAAQTALRFQPIGVVGLITPWNWPINQIALKAIPAMLAGCTCVLKPSEESPLNAMIFAEVCHAAGIPPGVFNLVNGDALGVGARLSTHPDVAMISFTGSTRAGKAITIAAAETLKRVTLELGGKGANLVFADADPDAVARGVKRMMNNSGQSCNAPSRMLVERSIYEETVIKVATLVNAIKIGPADQPGDHIGPVVNKRQWEQIQSFIRSGISEGARLITGGPDLPEGFNRGFYVKPTVFADVTPKMTIAREEIFGPVMCMMPFDSEDEAVRIANDTPYGLTNYVQTGDQKRANRLSRHLNSGMIEINGQSRGQGTPFGGIKNSGGAREGGVWGIEEFLILKTISGYDFNADTL